MNEYIQPEDECPLWRIAVKNILERFKQDGYGVQFEHEMLKSWMGINAGNTKKEWEKASIDMMIGIEKIRDCLLEDYNLYLRNVRGHGYRIAHPKTQIRECADYYVRKSQKSINKAMRVTVNTDPSYLDTEDKEIQINKMNRIAFVKTAFRNPTLPIKKNVKEIV